MRVLELETFGRGGLIHYAYNLSAALAERGHEVTLVTTRGYELEGRAELPAGVLLIKAIARWSQGPGASWPAPILNVARKIEAVIDAFSVTALARRLRPDVIHLHCTNPIAALYTTLLSRLGRPLVVTAHVVTPHEPMPFQAAVYGRIHRLADLLIAHSEVDRKRLRDEFGIESEHSVVIPHGEYGFFEREAEPADRSTARQSLGLEAHHEVALFFGYIREYKGLDALLEAWPEVAAARPGARLLIAGDPVRLGRERREEFEDRASRLGAVHHFGYVPFADVHRYFAAADLLAMPYKRISQSGVLYLALSLGLPVVASRVGALSEMLRDGDSALMVPPDSPAALSAALIRALSDAELRRTLVRGGRRVAERHSWPRIAESTEAAFARLVDSSSG